MGKEEIPCCIIERGAQGGRDGSVSTDQSFLLGRLGFVANSKLLGIAIAGA